RICRRERCFHSVVGEAREDQKLVVDDPLLDECAVDMPLEVLLGKPPRMHREVKHDRRAHPPLDLRDVSLKEAAYRVLRLPAVADKTFLISIGYRTVGGLGPRHQL